MTSAVRRSSSAFATTSRTRSTRPQSTDDTTPSGIGCQVEKSTESSRSPGSSAQISSPVKLSIGAIHRTIASATCIIAVCAERRG